MKTASILCNGAFPRKAYPLYLLESADFTVCCDAAAEKYVRHTGRQPDVVIGDLDSIRPSVRKSLTCKLIHETEQDDNDQTKAVRYLLRNHPEIETIHILGATGLREDHTIGNLSLLMEYTRIFPLEGRTIDIVSDFGTAFPLTDSVELHVGKGRRVSLFSPDNSLTIKSDGLEWQTGGVVFDNWWKATLNRASKDIVSLEFSHPSMALVILD